MIQKNFLLIALRYLRTNQKDASINSMIRICFIGISIATCALALVVCVMEGFEHATYQKMQSIYPDLILDSRGSEIDIEALRPILLEEQYHITHFSEQRLGQALLYNQEYASPTVIYLRGIEPKNEQNVTALSLKTTHPTKNNTLPEMIHDHQIFIGNKLAKQLHLNVKDEAKILYSNDEPERLTITFQQTAIHIGGIFKTGIDDFDLNLVFCSAELFDSLFPDQGITQVYIKLSDKKHDVLTSTLLQKRLNVDVYSWKNIYPALVSALKLEKYAMFFILLLIVLIASMNIISLIFMYVTQKKKEIALLICFGMPLHKIKQIFICISLYISFFATTIGLAFAYCIGLLLQTYPIISLPDEAYITTHLPIKLDPTIFCVIFISSLILSFCASLISTKKLNKIDIAQTLKYE